MFSKKNDGRGLRRPLLVLGAVAVLFAADSAYAALGYRSDMQQAACDLKRAADSIDDLDLDAARRHLDAAVSEARSAAGFLRHVPARVAGSLPWLGPNVDALGALARAAEAASLAGLAGADAASDMGLGDPGGLGSVYADGKVSLPAIEAGAVRLRAALPHLEAAGTVLQDSPIPSIGPIRSAFFGARKLVRKAQRRAADGRVALDALPSILGGSTPRRYFLAFQSPSEARGGGGLVGVYGILEARDGALSLDKVAPIRELVPRLHRAVPGPRWFERLYGDLAGLRGWREANQSPTFPTSSEVLLKMYEASTGKELDGVISMDPFVVQDLMDGLGPIEVRGLDVPVSADNAADVLLRDIYLRFAGREDEQNAYLRRLVDELWSRLGSGEVDAEALARAIARSISTQHLKMYSRNDADQAALAGLGLTGDPSAYGPNVQMVFHNNFAANKVDYFLHRTQDVTVSIDEAGDAHVVTTVFLRNDAPRKQRSLLKKSDVNELPSGLNQMSLHFMLPAEARVNDYYLGAIQHSHFSGKEAGIYPEVWDAVQVQVQQTIDASVSYTIPGFADMDAGTFDMTFLPQALVHPDRLELRVVAPSGYRIGRPGSGSFSADPFEIDTTLTKPKRVSLRLLAPGDPQPPAADELASACG